LKEKLIASKQDAFISKELAILDEQVPLDAELEDLAFPEPNREELFRIFNELEFRKFAQEYAPEGTVLEPVGDLKMWAEDSYEGKPVFIAYDAKSLRKSGH